MKLKTIDNILWFIPVRSWRNHLRKYLIHKYNLEIDNFNKKVEELYNKRKIKVVYIETINRCNSTCNFCPVSVGNEKREYKKMTEELFNKIIDDLVAMNYKDSVGLFLTNEPFLDNRIIKFAEIAKTKLPNAFIHLFSNGTVLTLDKFIEAHKYLDMIYINNYNNDNKLHDTVQKIYDFCLENREYSNKTVIIMRRTDEILSSRAGNAPNKKDQLKSIPQKCFLPALQFPIRPDGKVSLCCCDTYGEITLGDLNENTIEEIWNSEKYKNIIKLLKEGRDKIKICKYCDYLDEIPDSLDFIHKAEHFKNGSDILKI